MVIAMGPSIILLIMVLTALYSGRAKVATATSQPVDSANRRNHSAAAMMNMNMPANMPSHHAAVALSTARSIAAAIHGIHVLGSMNEIFWPLLVAASRADTRDRK